MLTRLYPISLDTYSISDAQVYCCNVLHRLDIASHSHADSPALLFSAHTIDIALLCSDIPTSGLFLLPSLSFHTLPKHTLPALLCTSLMNSFLWESNFLSASPSRASRWGTCKNPGWNAAVQQYCCPAVQYYCCGRKLLLSFLSGVGMYQETCSVKLISEGIAAWQGR